MTNPLIENFRLVGLVYIENSPEQRMIVRDLDTNEWRLIANDQPTTELGRFATPELAAKYAYGHIGLA